MNLMKTMEDDTMPVAGFEQRTFACPACGDVEQRLAFRSVGQDEVEAAPTHAAPSILPASPHHDEHAAGLLRRVAARLRGA
jgi:hypothetical protein